MRTALALLCSVIAATTVAAQTPAATGVRLKDVAALQGPAPQPLIGYGLVVGLNKTGDRAQTIFSKQSLANMLEKFGVSVTPGEFKIENVAAVLVTAEMSPYAQLGGRIDVTVSSIGDARSLQGGTLLPTPLRASDGAITASAQGPVSIGGFGAGSGGTSVTVNHLTVGRIQGGALVQVVRSVALPAADRIGFGLHTPDFVSARRIAEAINHELDAEAASATDAGTVMVQVPAAFRNAIPAFVARLEPLAIEMDSSARVVINERTGTVVLGGDVRLGPAAVAHGSLSVRIATTLDVSQPAPLSRGQTTVVPRTEVDVQERDARLIELHAGSTLAQVVSALNTLGASPRDIIAIMQALKAAGALRAEIVIL